MNKAAFVNSERVQVKHSLPESLTVMARHLCAKAGISDLGPGWGISVES